MKKQNTLFSLVIVLLVFGCTSPAAATRLPIESPVSHPSRTPIVEAQEKGIKEEKFATATSIPTSATEPPLTSSGPYFAYFREMNGIYQLVMMDADGQGRKIIDLPQGIVDAFPNKQYDLDMRLVSPDGRRLAFYTGHVGNLDSRQPAPKEFDLTLNLLDLVTGEEQVITPLLSKDYPNNFAQASKSLNDPLLTPEVLQYAFLYGIVRAMAWSPDGRYLAFAGQMGGLSSDLYVYDTNMHTVRRLTDGSGELQWIQWSPDGEWILHGSAHEISMGSAFDVYVAKLDGSPARYLTTTSSIPFKKWLNSHAYFDYEAENGIGTYGLRLIDVNGEIIRIWEGAFYSYEFSKNGKWVVINAMLPDISPDRYSGNDPDFRSGPYLINLKTLEKTRVPIPSDETFTGYRAFSFDLQGQEFILVGDTSQSFFLSENLELSPVEVSRAKISISPDQTSWAAVANNAVSFYSAANVPRASLKLPFSDADQCDWTWMPNSTGLLLMCHSTIYSILISTGEIHSLEIHKANHYRGPGFLWIAGH